MKYRNRGRIYLMYSLPRSGTRMVCHALHQHPQVWCSHEFLNKAASTKRWINDTSKELLSTDKYKAIAHGQVYDISLGMLFSDVPKIFLKRSSYLPGTSEINLRRLSYGRRDINWSWIANDVAERGRKSELLEHFADLVIDYDDITDGKEIEEIPEHIGRLLCDFLEVDYHPLVTPQRKNEKMKEWEKQFGTP